MNERDEYNYFLVSDGLFYGDQLTFVPRDLLDSKTGFRSLYAVRKEDAEAIQQAGTAKGFKGVVWSERIEIDVDTEGDSVRVRSYLQENQYDFMEWSTGNRGSHFSILRSCLPSHLLPQQDRQWIRERFPFADLSIYSHLHLFRLPGTVHEKTGKRKTMVLQQSGKGVTHDKPVPVHDPSIDSSPDTCYAQVGSVLDDYQVSYYSFPAIVGNRHFSLVNVAYGLHRLGVGSLNARWYLHEVNKRYKVPKEPDEVDKIVRSVYGGTEAG